MMERLFITVLSLSLSGSLLMLPLLLCRPLYRERLSKRWQYYIWLVVAVRLLLPFAPGVGPVGALFREAFPPRVLNRRNVMRERLSAARTLRAAIPWVRGNRALFEDASV